jgi:hypothetical protein
MSSITITKGEFIEALGRAKYALVESDSGTGVYSVTDSFTTYDYPDGAWALEDKNGKEDPIILADYLDDPNVDIIYDHSNQHSIFETGMPTFIIDSSKPSFGEPVEITLFNAVTVK